VAVIYFVVFNPLFNNFSSLFFQSGLQYLW